MVVVVVDGAVGTAVMGVIEWVGDDVGGVMTSEEPPGVAVVDWVRPVVVVVVARWWLSTMVVAVLSPAVATEVELGGP